jgi:hypothetical protein
MLPTVPAKGGFTFAELAAGVLGLRTPAAGTEAVLPTWAAGAGGGELGRLRGSHARERTKSSVRGADTFPELATAQRAGAPHAAHCRPGPRVAPGYAL